MTTIIIRSLAALSLLLVAACPIFAQQQARNLPDFGLMLNEDGNIIFKLADPDPKVCRERLTKALDVMKGTPVKTLVYNAACGSDIMDYPTKAGNMWGWRVAGEEAKEPWKTRIGNLRPAAAAGMDNLRTAADWAKGNGLLFVPSFRVNDAHFAHDPHNNVHTGKFWVENHERVTLKKSPVPGRDLFNEILDFSHPEVRAYRMGIIREIIDRYADIMDGFQLDFMRHPAYFPDAATPEQAALITDMMVEIRQQLDELGRKHGRDYALMVRVPPTLKHSRRVGLDVETWLKRRLVDIVTPAPAITLSHDLPTDEFVALAAPVGAKVYPTLCDRTQYTWPFVAAPTAETYSGNGAKWDDFALGTLVRGAVVNHRAMGAAGFELYNYNLPLSADAMEAARAASEENPAQGTRVYAITPQFNLDYTDTYEPPKQIAATLQPRQPLTLKLYVGEQLSSGSAAKAALRLGLALGKQEPASLSAVKVSLNGKPLHTGPLSNHYTAITSKPPKKAADVRTAPPAASGYLQLPIADVSIVKQGWNEITVQVDSAGDAAGKIVVSEAVLGVMPESSAR